MRKRTHQEFLKRARKIHKDRYEYPDKYQLDTVPIRIICKKHGVFKQKPNKHLSGQNCPKCAQLVRVKKNSKSHEVFLLEARTIHGDKYAYPEKHKTAKTRMKIICPDHGSFRQTSDSHIGQGAGCPKCCGARISESKTYTQEQFLELAGVKHANKYIYISTRYIDIRTEVYITCRKHGVFSQLPMVHLRGSGCQLCGIETTNAKNLKPTILLVAQFIAIHGNKYDYSEVENRGSHHKVKIGCKKHGKPFLQNPNAHLRGSGCPKCGQSQTISKSETIWLNQLGIPNDKEHRQVVFRFPEMSKRQYIKVDGFDPETKTMYEYLGDFYHGNPAIFKSDDYNNKLKETHGKLYQIFLQRKEMIERNGYKLITIWGSDFIALAQKTV